MTIFRGSNLSSARIAWAPETRGNLGTRKNRKSGYQRGAGNDCWKLFKIKGSGLLQVGQCFVNRFSLSDTRISFWPKIIFKTNFQRQIDDSVA